MPVHAGELEFVLEVGNRAQAAQDHAGTRFAHEVGKQRGKALDFDVGEACQGQTRERDAVVQTDARSLAGALGNADDDAIEQGRSAADQVDVAVRDRIERARIDRYARSGRIDGLDRLTLK